MPRPFPDLLKKAEGARREGTQMIARWAITYWLFLYWFNDLAPKALKSDRLLSWYNSIFYDEKDAAKLKKIVEKQQVQFFTDTFPNKEWLEIAKGLRSPTASDCCKFVRQYLSLKEPLPSKLVNPETSLLGTKGLDGAKLLESIGSLYESGLAWEEGHLAREVAGGIYRRYQKDWQNSTPDFSTFHRAASNEQTNGEDGRSSLSFQQSTEFLKNIEISLTPLLLCHYSLLIRKLKLSPKVWEPFCVPEVVRDGCYFFLENILRWVSDMDFLRPPKVWEVSGL